MAKRVIDTELWKVKWFRVLTPAQKCFVRYLFDRCDVAGVWDVDFEQAEFLIGGKVDRPVMDWLPHQSIHPFNGDAHWLLLDFLMMQYPGGLNNAKPITVKVRAILDQYDLTKVVSRVYGNGFARTTKLEEYSVKKTKYGSDKKVLLTIVEYERLVVDEGKARTDQAIEFLNGWIVEKSYVSKDHNRSIRRWVFDVIDTNNSPELPF